MRHFAALTRTVSSCAVTSRLKILRRQIEMLAKFIVAIRDPTHNANTEYVERTEVCHV